MNESNQPVARVQGHTPGPWKAWDDDGTGTLPCVLANQVTSYGNFYVAQCNVFEDAKLIAAAPDLLAALERAIAASDEPGSDYDWIGEAVKAIQKARGTNETP